LNKDNLLFATIGLLLGFISGYLMHEVMVARQPLRRPAGEAMAAAVTPGPGAGDPAAEPDSASAAAAEGGAAAPGPGGAGEGNGAPPAVDGAGTGAGASPGGGAGSAGGQGGAMPPAMAAIQELRDHVAAHPEDADAVLKLANLNFDISNWGRARDLYTQYLRLRPSNPDVLTDLGTCFRQLRQFDRALEQYRRAEQLAPTHWRSRFWEVVVLVDLNQGDAANQAFARLQALAPGQPEVARLGAELQRRRGAG
jgi:tetratricopeptide (TPR) repeat protein